MSNRLLPLSGVVFFVLALLAIEGLGGSTPDIKASPAKITSFYTVHHGRQSVAPFVVAIGALFFVLFGASLWQALTDGAGDALGRLAGSVVLVGTAVAAGGYLVAAAVHLALAQAVHHGIGPAGAQALNALDVEDFQPFAIGTAIVLLGAWPLMMRRPGAFRWLAWVALVLGVASFTPIGFFAFLGANLWIVAVSILLSLRSAPAAAISHPAAVAATS
jgi:hypothetical protein